MTDGISDHGGGRVTGDWEALEARLQDRLTMAREVLDQEGMNDVAALVPIEEVLIWMKELSRG